MPRGTVTSSPTRNLFVRWRTIGAALIILGLPLCSWADRNVSGVTVDDLVGRTQISSWSVSPDGNYVAFLTAKALPRLNLYEITLHLRPATESAQTTILAQYSLMPQ